MSETGNRGLAVVLFVRGSVALSRTSKVRLCVYVVIICASFILIRSSVGEAENALTETSVCFEGVNYT